MRGADIAGRTPSSRRYLKIAALIAVSLAVLVLAACGAATEPQGPSACGAATARQRPSAGGAATEPQRPSVSTPGDIVALMDTPRLTSLSSEGRVVTAEGQATRAGGDDLRTYWFTSLGAIAHVQHLGGSLIVRRVLDGTTLLDPDEASQEEPVGTLTDPATFLSEEDLNAHALRWADEAEAIVEEVNYVPFFGGAAEFVLRPKDELEFMRELDLRMYEFFCGLPQEPRPFLMTIVDSSGAIRRVWGGFLLSDPDQGLQTARMSDGTKIAIAESDGFAAQAPDLTKALGVDAGGRPVETGPVETVEGAPGP
jgi:hypothetical protein